MKIGNDSLSYSSYVTQRCKIIDSLFSKEQAMKSVAIFLGASGGNNESYKACARQTGRHLAAKGITLVYGGSNVGLMGILADEVLARGGKVIGVIPRFLAKKEVAHDGLTELHFVETMHERKALMAELADAFLALPGGYGTLDELCEILTWAQLKLHNKPIGLINHQGYFQCLLKFFDQAEENGFLSNDLRSLLLEAQNAEEAITLLQSHINRFPRANTSKV
jgi:uncharacterized protein (TIGR00730 family)